MAFLYKHYIQKYMEIGEDDKMRELEISEIESINVGLGPLAIIGIDLALNGVFIAYAAYRAEYG